MSLGSVLSGFVDDTVFETGFCAGAFALVFCFVFYGVNDGGEECFSI